MPAIAKSIDVSEAFALFFAAVIHDFRHPGVNQTYLVRAKRPPAAPRSCSQLNRPACPLGICPQINARDELAVRYNDHSVLEHYHVSEAFRVLWGTDSDSSESAAAEASTAAAMNPQTSMNIIASLSPEESRVFRERVIKVCRCARSADALLASSYLCTHAPVCCSSWC